MSIKLIELNKKRGKKSFTKVSEEDFEELDKYFWNRDAHGYAVRFPGIKMHRVIMRNPLGMEIDHINGDRCDNTRENLRVCTRSQNQHNQKSRNSGLSKYKGVTYCKRVKKYLAQIVIDGKRKYLKYESSEEAAARIYDEAAKKYFGEFANLNFGDSK